MACGLRQAIGSGSALYHGQAVKGLHPSQMPQFPQPFWSNNSADSTQKEPERLIH